MDDLRFIAGLAYSVAAVFTHGYLKSCAPLLPTEEASVDKTSTCDDLLNLRTAALAR